MTSILEIGGEHLTGVLNGETESLRSLFAARVTGWGKPFAHEEGITVGLFSDVEQEIESHVAFALVEPAANIALAQENETNLLCALALLRSLVDATHTTEVPASLKSTFPALVANARSFGALEAAGQLTELSAYYRHAL